MNDEWSMSGHDDVVPGFLVARARLIHMDMFRFGVFLQAVQPEFPSDPALLVPAEGSALVEEMPFVDPDRAGAE